MQALGHNPNLGPILRVAKAVSKPVVSFILNCRRHCAGIYCLSLLFQEHCGPFILFSLTRSFSVKRSGGFKEAKTKHKERWSSNHEKPKEDRVSRADRHVSQ